MISSLAASFRRFDTSCFSSARHSSGETSSALTSFRQRQLFTPDSHWLQLLFYDRFRLCNDFRFRLRFSLSATCSVTSTTSAAKVSASASYAPAVARRLVQKPSQALRLNDFLQPVVHSELLSFPGLLFLTKAQPGKKATFFFFRHLRLHPRCCFMARVNAMYSS